MFGTETGYNVEPIRARIVGELARVVGFGGDRAPDRPVRSRAMLGIERRSAGRRVRRTRRRSPLSGAAGIRCTLSRTLGGMAVAVAVLWPGVAAADAPTNPTSPHSLIRATAPTCTVDWSSVVPGERGPRARCVEEALVWAGHDIGEPDHVFDTVSVSALADLARSEGIVWRGAATPRLLDALGIWGGDDLGASCTIAWGRVGPGRNPNSAATACVEHRLAQLGYSIEGPSDVLDDTSAAALEHYATSHGFEWTGEAGSDVLVALGIWTGPPPSNGCTVTTTVFAGAGNDHEATACVKRRLADLGYRVQGPSEHLDPVSLAALQHEAGTHRIPWKNAATPQLLDALDIWSGFALTGTCDLSTPVVPGSNPNDLATVCVERRLAQLGYAVDASTPDFDPVSVASLIEFQQTSGLPADGYVGAATLTALGLWQAPAPTDCRIGDDSLDESDVQCVEQRLVELGYALRGPDTAFDDTTDRALRAFQSSAGMPVDGIAGPVTLTGLNIYDPTMLPDDSGTGRRVVYSKSKMRVWTVEEDGTVSKTHLVSGRRDWSQPTPGTYSVFSRSRYTCNVDNRNICWPYMVRFATGSGGDNIGFHEIPTNVSTGNKVQSTSQLGQALSSGCVRQSHGDAVYMWNWAHLGTKVVVLP